MLVRRDADDIREIRPRAALGAIVVICAMLVLLVRLYQLQILRGDAYTTQSIANFRKSLWVPADRGLIKDREGRTLVENRPSFDVFMTPAYCKGKERDEVIEKLKDYLKLTDEDVERIEDDYEKSWYSADKLERFKPFLLALDIPRDQVEIVEAHKTEMTCVDVIPSPHRAYHVSPSFGHTVGYMSEVSPDELKKMPEYRQGQMIGKSGLERRWEKELRGVDGKEQYAVDAKGRRLDKDTQDQLIPDSERLVPATPGNNLILSIDERLQDAADQAFPGRAGAVVVMEAKTGFVLAMVSRPSFDPNKMSARITAEEMRQLSSDPLKPMLNRVMNENYHPGSTFKVVTSMAGLEANLINERSSISCNGGYTMGNHRWRCDKPSGHGSLTVKSALQYSCDVFYYALGDKVGLDGLSQMAHRLGYGQPTGFDVGREIPGIIPSTKTITADTGSPRAHAINAAIGQGEINVTPLQQAVAYAAIANGGTVLRPQIVRRIETPDGKVVREFAPELDLANGNGGKLGVKESTLAAVRAGLVAVVNEPGGTAFRLRLPDLKFAGKTGTAQVMKLGQKQKLDPTTQAYFSRDHAWFASFAPAEDPEIVVVVLNEHGGWGADAAAPTASKVIHAWWELKQKEAAVAQSTPAAAPSTKESVTATVAPPAPSVAATAVVH
jgi:penicillin-binding protein 2